MTGIISTKLTLHSSPLDPDRGFHDEEEAKAHHENLLRKRFLDDYVKASNFNTEIGKLKATNSLGRFMEAYRAAFEPKPALNLEQPPGPAQGDQPTGTPREGSNGITVT